MWHNRMVTAVEPTSPLAARCRNLVKRYDQVLAVDRLDLAVARGECFGLLGPNGAGKTTTIEILEGLLAADEGDVEVLGRRWGTDDRALRERLGIQLQDTQLNEKLTVEEIVRLFRSFYRRGRRVDDVLRLVGLESKRASWVGKLSGGQKQRLAVACALVNEPELLFLDEPTTGLDPQSRRQLWALLEEFRAGGGTIVLTTHYMEEAEALCDRVAIVDRGRVIATGTPAQLVATLGADHVVDATTADSMPDALVDAAKALPGVRDVRASNGGLSLVTGDVQQTIPGLLAEISRHRVRLSLLATHHATLEDVFVSLTGRHLRDD
ncbi:MAG: ABC transporter ATP-binding protein [Bacteroidales bacterium]